MPKRKFITEEELKAKFRLGGRKLIFDKESPIYSINKPKKTIGVIWESDQELNNLPIKVCDVGAGSIYFVREGNSKFPLKMDIYPFQWKRGEMTEILDKEYKKSKQIYYHHFERLPDWIEKQAKEGGADWLIDEIQEVLKRLENE